MQVILSGSTGFIGSEVLSQALAHPSITSLICITRRALPDSITSNPKVKVIILSDFTKYTPEVLTQLSGSEACIWSVPFSPMPHRVE
jgi:NAD dependent epimerase/dehydratase family enzyme